LTKLANQLLELRKYLNLRHINQPQ